MEPKFVQLNDLEKVRPGVWKLMNQAFVGSDELDMARLKKQIADQDGVRNTVDDLLTDPNTADLSMEDTHEDLP